MQSSLLRRGLVLEYLTLGWNVVGVVLVIVAAYAAHSVALAGFGLDSLVKNTMSNLTMLHLKREPKKSRAACSSPQCNTC